MENLYVVIKDQKTKVVIEEDWTQKSFCTLALINNAIKFSCLFEVIFSGFVIAPGI